MTIPDRADATIAPRTTTGTPRAADRMLGVERRLLEASRALEVATGGAALCRVDGAGGAKELEGRVAALLEVRRRLRSDPEADLADIAARWRVHLARHRDRGTGPAWRHYLDGGVSELALLDGEPPDQPTS